MLRAPVLSIKGESMKVQTILSLTATLLLAWAATNTNAQESGSFSNLFLFGEAPVGEPEINFFSKDQGFFHRIGTGPLDLFFDVEGDTKFSINRFAQNNGVWIDEFGVNTTAGIVTRNPSGDEKLVLTPSALRLQPENDPGVGVFAGLQREGTTDLNVIGDKVKVSVGQGQNEPIAEFKLSSIDLGQSDNQPASNHTLRIFDSLGSLGSIFVKSDIAANQELLLLASPNAAKLSLKNDNYKWSIVNDSRSRFSVSLQGSGGPELTIKPDGELVVGPANNRRFVVKANGDAQLSGTLYQASDRNLKTDFQAVEESDILERLIALPITTWRYRKSQATERHIGPMAQDFRAAFGFGDTDTSIATVDAIGVTLSAVQALNRKLESELKTKKGQITLLQEQLDEQSNLIEALSMRLSTLEAR